jgi:hypothetical protein
VNDPGENDLDEQLAMAIIESSRHANQHSMEDLGMDEFDVAEER